MPERAAGREGSRPGSDSEPGQTPHLKPENTRGRYLLLLSLGALGIVYGDIGISPLYAFRESFHAAEGLVVNTGVCSASYR